MSKTLFAFLFLFLFLPCILHCQQFTWAMTDTTFYSSRALSLATDKAGSLIVSQLNSPGTSVIKYDANGQELWRRNLQAWWYSVPCVATDNMNNVYFACSGYGLTMDNSTISNFHGMLLIKLDSQGNIVWYKNAPGHVVLANAITIDTHNNLYVGGSFKEWANFDTVHLSGPSVHLSYVAKYDQNGNLKWVRHVSQDGNKLIGIIADQSGNIYIAGQFKRTVQFGPFSLTAYYPQGFAPDLYLAKLDFSGNWLWTQHSGGDGQDEAKSMSQDKKGNLYISGFMGSPTATFGSHTLTNTGDDDFFIAKYDTAGNAIWATNNGGPGTQIGGDICVGTNGTVYMGSNSKFINVFDTLGNYYTWYGKAASNDVLMADDSGGIYIAGFYQDSVTFGNYHLVAKHPSNNEMYIARMAGVTPVTSAAVNETFSSASLLVYPNPTHCSVTITCNTIPQGPAMLRIINSLGQEVYREVIAQSSGFRREINLGYRRGVYFAELLADGQRITRKIVLE